MFDWKEINDVINGSLFAFIAGLGGAVAYLSSIFGNRKKFVVADFLIKSVSSAFAGLIIGWIMIYYQYPITISCSVAGTAGYLGAEFTVSILKRFFINKFATEVENDDNK